MPYGTPESTVSEVKWLGGVEGPEVGLTDPRAFTAQISVTLDSNIDETLVDDAFQVLLDWIDSSPNFSVTGGKQAVDNIYTPVTVTP